MCGRSASTVWREGGPTSIGPPYPDLHRPVPMTRYIQCKMTSTNFHPNPPSDDPPIPPCGVSQTHSTIPVTIRRNARGFARKNRPWFRFGRRIVSWSLTKTRHTLFYYIFVHIKTRFSRSKKTTPASPAVPVRQGAAPPSPPCQPPLWAPLRLTQQTGLGPHGSPGSRTGTPEET